MRNFKSKVLVNRYIEEIQRQIVIQGRLVQELEATGLSTECARTRLRALERSLSALQVRAANVTNERP